MSERVMVVIDPEKMTIQYEVKGRPGAKCKDITDLLRQGKKVVQEQVTAEYYRDDDKEFVSVK